MLNKRWFEVVHAHSRLSQLVQERNEAKRSIKQLGQFRADPMKFGKSLFEKSISGEPAFSETAGFDYFSSLYTDKNRGPFRAS